MHARRDWPTSAEADLDVMALFHKETMKEVLRRIRADFLKWETQSLTKREFVIVMMEHITHIPNKLQIVSTLLELFDQIDVNYDKHLEWQELSNQR